MPILNPHGTADRSVETHWTFDLKLSQLYLSLHRAFCAFCLSNTPTNAHI